MAFDQEILVVQSGKPIELIFENVDIMPHNVVLTLPGAMEQVGIEAEEGATAADALARHYVPASDRVIWGSRLLQPGERQTLSFVAPSAAGVYPYVCTYPGHWRRMFGAMYVVDDLDAYLEDPTGYLAAHPVEILDPLLADNRPRTAWTLEDLADDLSLIESERSYAHGREMFQVASCAACHQLGGVGVVFGPDLTQRDPMWKAGDVLREILQPSLKIHEKFRTEVFELESGETLSGLVVGETETAVRIVANPLVATDAVEIAKGDIAVREALPVSLMPEGLLDKLTREEILDLLAFVMADGRSEDTRFVDGHEHHHGGTDQGADHGSEHDHHHAP
ncbi:MAG TPA: hypothetical protein DCQ98_00955 [Planctomycetaceae bacterium]|nr:hypothetical protein [Planctomycetaceae bacterium]